MLFRSPSTSTIIKISRILNVSYNEFFSCVDQELYHDGEFAVSDFSDNNVGYPKKVELRSKIYELSDDEKELILRFRSLSIKGQNDFLNNVFNYEPKDKEKLLKKLKNEKE